MSVYVGVGNKARKVSKIYVGDENNKAREVKNAYVGVNNIARQTYTSYVPPVEGNVTISFVVYNAGKVAGSLSYAQTAGPSTTINAGSCYNSSVSVSNPTNSINLISLTQTGRLTAGQYVYASQGNSTSLSCGYDVYLNGTTRPFSGTLTIVSTQHAESGIGGYSKDYSSTLSTSFSFNGTSISKGNMNNGTVYAISIQDRSTKVQNFTSTNTWSMSATLSFRWL